MNRKKLLITGLSLLLVAAVSVGATLAYFTDTSEAASNVFTMGHVSADVVDTTGNLDGEDSPGRRVVTGTLNDPDDPLSGLVYSDVLPGDVIDKTVGAVLYADSMEAWLAVKLEVTATPAEGSSLAAADVVAELLGLIDDQVDADEWEKVPQADGSVIYYYKQPVAPDYDASTDTYSAVTKTLFDRILIPGAEWDNKYAGLSFEVKAQAAAVQEDYVSYDAFKAMDWNAFEKYPVASSSSEGETGSSGTEEP